MRTITFNQWKKRHSNRRILVSVGIGKVDLFAIWWWKGGRIGLTILGFGLGLIPKEQKNARIS